MDCIEPHTHIYHTHVHAPIHIHTRPPRVGVHMCVGLRTCVLVGMRVRDSMQPTCKWGYGGVAEEPLDNHNAAAYSVAYLNAPATPDAGLNAPATPDAGEHVEDDSSTDSGKPDLWQLPGVGSPAFDDESKETDVEVMLARMLDDPDEPANKRAKHSESASSSSWTRSVELEPALAEQLDNDPAATASASGPAAIPKATRARPYAMFRPKSEVLLPPAAAAAAAAAAPAVPPIAPGRAAILEASRTVPAPAFQPKGAGAIRAASHMARAPCRVYHAPSERARLAKAKAVAKENAAAITAARVTAAAKEWLSD
jgi:hypothetical protein